MVQARLGTRCVDSHSAVMGTVRRLPLLPPVTSLATSSIPLASLFASLASRLIVMVEIRHLSHFAAGSRE